VVSKAWKAVEKAVALYLGGKRMSNHALGLRTPDVESDWLSVECKSTKQLPFWLVKAMEQAERNASADKLPIVVLHQKGWRHDKDLVVMRLSEFREHFGEVTCRDEH